MKLEILKSVVLSVLILFSILLTVAIWNYQPNYNPLDSAGHADPQLNGQEQTNKETIEPVKIVFHLDGEHYRLENYTKEDELYSNIQNLSLLDFESAAEAGGAIEGEHLEIYFPLSLSARVLGDLFIIEEEDIPDFGTFNKISIPLEDEEQLSRVKFIDTETSEAFIAHTRKSDVDQIVSSYTNKENLQEQMIFYGKNNFPIYLPAEEPEMYEVALSVFSFSDKSTLNPLINVLFNDVRVLTENSIIGGEQYTDGMRQLRAYSNYMEYIDPTAEYKEMDQWSIIDQSMRFINDHLGWTTNGQDEYQLFDVNSRRNTVTYRMTYEDHPVFDKFNHLAAIRLTIHNQSVYEYSRPLFQLRDPLDTEPAEVGSGERVISLIEQNRELSANVVEEIVIGYKLYDQQGAVQLVPTWYYKDNTGWKELPVPEVANGGGN